MTTDCAYTVKFNELNTKINLDEAPKLSSVSIAVFNTLGGESNITSTIDFKIAANNLSDLKTRLQFTKEHPIRDKIYALLRLSATVAVVVMGVLGAFSPVAPVSILVSCLAAYVFFTLYNSHEADCEIYTAPQFLASLIATPFFPILELFKKATRLESSISKFENSIDKCLDQRIKFFIKDNSDLQTKLTKMIEDLKDSKKADDVKAQDRCFIALEELQKNTDFYTQLKFT